MWQDIRLAVRGFRKTPVFSGIAIATLALTVGVTTALFTLLNALLLRDVAVRDPRTLVQVSGARPGSTSKIGLTFPMYQELKRRQDVFSAVMGWLDASVVNIEISHEHTQAAVWVVSGNFYDELGVRPFAGRLLNDEDVNEQTLEPARVAVLGHSFWIRHYGADPQAVGQRIRVEDEWFEIVGIAPRDFRGLNLTIEPDVTLPLTVFPFITDGPRRTDLRLTLSSWVRTTGRLKHGATIEQARAALEAFWPELMQAAVPAAYAGAQRDRFLEVRPSIESAAKGIEPQLRTTFTTPLIAVLAIAGLILLIACVNLASLLLARAAARIHEMGVRLALGAGRARLVRQFLIEGLLLSSIGSACGVWIAYWGSQALAASIFRDYAVAASLPVAPDAHVIAFTATLAIVTGTLFSMAPAWLAGRVEVTALLQQGSRTATSTGQVGRLLIGAQVALSLVLLTHAGLLVRTLQEIRAVRSGLRTDGVFLASLAPLPGGHVGVDNDEYYRQLIDRAAGVPGVEKAALTLVRPAGGSGLTERVSKLDAPADGAGTGSWFMPVSPGMFEALGIPLKGGRDFSWSDNSRGQPVAVISENLARHLFPNSVPLGQRVRVGVSPHRQNAEIVGVVADARLYDLKNPNVAAVYVPALQEPNNNWKSLVIRGRSVPVDDLSRAVGSFGRERVRFTRTLDYVASRALLPERLIAMLATLFGGLALLLVSIGLYGLMSYAVAQRRREIGIRMALGADASAIIRAVVGEGLFVTLAGVAVGLAAALASVRLVKSLLFGVTVHDAITFVGGPLTLIAIAIIACLLPAARAARTDPMTILRAE
jgi:putative ABC transport system permease protein